MYHLLKYLVLALLILGSLASEGEFEYVEGNEDWSGTCATGTRQSPINIVSSNVTSSSGKIILSGYVNSSDIDICLTHLTLKTTYTDTEMDIRENTNWTKWHSLQFHFHSPSEHQIDGVYSAAELHMVFQGITLPDQLSVFGFLFDIDEDAEPNEFIESLKLEDLDHTQAESCNALHISLSKLFESLTSHKKYNYQGSLTTPPCTENVEWFVFKDTIKITSAELDHMTNFWKINTNSGVFEGNNRNVQALNGRAVKLIN
jgi:carbonic anhydrase